MTRKEHLQQLKGRASILAPETRDRLTAFADKCAENDTPENAKKATQLRIDALEDAGKMRELNKARIITVDNFVVAQTNAGSFFRVVPLEIDEEPFLVNLTGQEMKARYIGEDGKPHLTQIQKKMARRALELSYVGTEKLEYPLTNIYTGQVAQEFVDSAPLARDLAINLDQKLWPLIKALPLATFVTTGTEANRSFVLHSAIDPNNVPAGNLLDLHAEGAFNFNIIKGIVKYFMQIGNTFSAQQITPVAIYVPSIDVGGFIDQIDLTSQGTNDGVRQIFEGGYVMRLGNYSFAIVGDSTLKSSDGRLYVRTNKSIGDWFTKIALDSVFPNNPNQVPEAWRDENKGYMSMKKVFGAVTPLPYGINMVAVQYKPAASS